MNDIALYYPYVDFRDEAWLKAVVLHWPKLALIDAGGREWRPESDTVRRPLSVRIK
jgi:hypothetical protein